MGGGWTGWGGVRGEGSLEEESLGRLGEGRDSVLAGRR